MDVDPVYRERIAGILGGYLEEGRGLTGFGTISGQYG